MIRENERSAVSGLLMMAILLISMAFFGYAAFQDFSSDNAFRGVGWVFLWIGALVCLGGLFVVNPNEGRVLQLFGDYRGTVKEAGLRWANPFYTKRNVSLRVRNFESQRLKV